MSAAHHPHLKLVSASEHAEIALRCAWLREHARRLFAIDTTGQLSVQLLDFADLLEVAEQRGWFDADLP